MGLLKTLPAALSLLLLAAHILHAGGSWLLIFACVAPCALLRSRNRWLLYFVQTVLAIAAIEWIFTAYDIMQQRQLAGQAWLRAAIILIAVAALNVGAAALFLRWQKT